MCSFALKFSISTLKKHRVKKRDEIQSMEIIYMNIIVWLHPHHVYLEYEKIKMLKTFMWLRLNHNSDNQKIKK